MQNIDLICIGKMNASYFASGVAEYQKRLGGFCNFRIIELPEASIADKNASDRQIAKALQKEADAILASVRKGAYLVALCVEGKQISSEDLAALLAERAGSGADREVLAGRGQDRQLTDRDADCHAQAQGDRIQVGETVRGVTEELGDLGHLRGRGDDADAVALLEDEAGFRHHVDVASAHA